MRYPMTLATGVQGPVMGRPNQPPRGALKTGHQQEASMPIGASSAGMSPPRPTIGHGEPTQGGGHTCDSSTIGAGMVASAHRPGAGRAPGDGRAVRAGTGSGAGGRRDRGAENRPKRPPGPMRLARSGTRMLRDLIGGQNRPQRPPGPGSRCEASGASERPAACGGGHAQRLRAAPGADPGDAGPRPERPADLAGPAVRA